MVKAVCERESPSFLVSFCPYSSFLTTCIHLGGFELVFVLYVRAVSNKHYILL